MASLFELLGTMGAPVACRVTQAATAPLQANRRGGGVLRNCDDVFALNWSRQL